MNCKYLLSRPLLVLLVFLMIALNSWVTADTSDCAIDTLMLNQSETESEEEKSQDSSEDEDEEEDEEPECD